VGTSRRRLLYDSEHGAGVIAFCTSFRARALANDWAYHTWLLERVVHSMLSQARGETQVVVGCHDVPDSPLRSDSRVHFLPIAAQIPERNFDDMVTDKVLKLSAAAQWVVARGEADYVAFNDADDLVSDRIGAFVDANPGANGWYTTSQRFYTYGGRLMRLQQINGGAAGPCVIVRRDLLTFATPPFQGAWVDLVRAGGEERYLECLSRHRREVCELAAVGLGYYRGFMAARGQPLAALPFAANVVINHKDSMSTAGGQHGFPLMSSLGSLKRSIRWLPSLRLATASVRDEFHIPATGEIPDAYRGGASVFWR
jgi:hypothetical protein